MKISYKFGANIKEMNYAFNNLKSEISCDFAKSTVKNWDNVAMVAEKSYKEVIDVVVKWGCDSECIS